MVRALPTVGRAWLFAAAELLMYGAGTLLVSANMGPKEGFADPLTTLPAQLSMKWAGTRVSSTNTWEQ